MGGLLGDMENNLAGGGMHDLEHKLVRSWWKDAALLCKHIGIFWISASLLDF